MSISQGMLLCGYDDNSNRDNFKIGERWGGVGGGKTKGFRGVLEMAGADEQCAPESEARTRRVQKEENDCCAYTSQVSLGTI